MRETFLAADVEAQQLARMAAERLLSPRERAKVNEPEKTRQKAPEPSLQERLDAIDRRAREYVERERRELLETLLDEARRRFKAAIARTTDPDVRKAYEEVVRFERLA